MKPKIAEYAFADIYPLYLKKAERKGRTKAELDAVICWLTGYSEEGLARKAADDGGDLDEFFADAPRVNPGAAKITGKICGARVEEIKEPVVQKIRWMDKLVDELAKGKALEKIMRAT